MQFDYKISVDEYISSQILYHRLRTGSKRKQRAIGWILAGLFFIIIAWNERVLNWAPVLLAIIGGWWIYAGIRSFFPRPYFRRFYCDAGLDGKKFHADVSEEGFKVIGEFCDWFIRWAGVTLKGEDKHVFMLYSEGTIFMFGKKHLTEEQQSELRKLAGLETN